MRKIAKSQFMEDNKFKKFTIKEIDIIFLFVEKYNAISIWLACIDILQQKLQIEFKQN